MKESREEEGTVPLSWVRGNVVFWPPGVQALEEKREPTVKWRKFPLIKIKFKSGKSLWFVESDNIYKQWDLFVQLLLTVRFEECENHNATTAEVSDDENVLGYRKKTKKTFTDFITGRTLDTYFFVNTIKKKEQSCPPA